jgi:hypothetical protein
MMRADSCCADDGNALSLRVQRKDDARSNLNMPKDAAADEPPAASVDPNTENRLQPLQADSDSAREKNQEHQEFVG